MAIQWDTSYSVGIKTFDEHHLKMVELLNSLESSGAANSDTGQVIKALKELLDYSVYHFTAEEKEFRAYNHPNPQRQINEHKRFTTKIEDFTTLFLAGSEPDVSDVITFLNDWIFHHIHEVDKNYGMFLHDKGCR